jgi:ATP-dependent exoDNAse (exonuclease V) beta subunit
VPVLLRPDHPDTTLASNATKTPLWAYAGAIDMLYVDPSDGSLVIADYKTDTEPNPQSYASPLAAYADAIKRALRLESKPRTELWFIAVGTVTKVSG